MGEPFTGIERRALLDEYFAARDRVYDLTLALDDAEGEEEGRIEAELASAQDRVSELWDRYEQGVPVIPISRCPFSGTPVLHSLDILGLDGLWWNYDAPVRPLEQLPSTYFALAGSVKLGEPLEEAPFLSRPGPEVPYVVPRLLQIPGVKAVVSSAPVGGHTAYPIFYYADPVPREVSRINTWGTADYWFHNWAGEYVWDRVLDDPSDFDFDLEKWIRAGRLLWIAPGDGELLLRSDVGRCPYLGLAGRREPLAISGGQVWSALGMRAGAGFASPELDSEQLLEGVADDR